MSSRLQGLRILVVDDNDDGRLLLAVHLQLAGASVTAVAGVDEAMGVVRASVPDVIVSDLYMPAKDGIELVREVRTLEAGSARRIVAILVTGASEEDCMAAHQAGYDDCLRRPFEPNSLTESVCRLTGRDAP